MPKQTVPEARVSKDKRVNLRTSGRQEAILRRAAAATDHTLTDFILDSAVEHAERVLADRRLFIANDEQLDEFQRLLDAPLASTKRFAALAARKSPFSSIQQ